MRPLRIALICNTVFVIVMQIKLVVVVVVPGIRQKVDVIKSQLSFVDCFTAQA